MEVIILQNYCLLLNLIYTSEASMNIMVISDLHMCNKDHFGVFDWNEDEFISLTELYMKQYKIDLLFLNGDVFEMYKYRYKHIAKSYSRLIEFFNRKDVILLRGNHDSLYRDSHDEFNIISSEHKWVHIEHGHNADFMNGNPVMRFVQRFTFRALRVLTRNKLILKIYHKFLSYTENKDIDRRKRHSAKYLQYALSLSSDFDVVILGHAHELRKHTYYINGRKKYYFCTGTCSLGRFQGIILNTETLEHKIIKEADSYKQGRSDIGKSSQESGEKEKLVPVS